MIQLSGHLERITFRNPENHYTVARFREAGTRNRVTVVGYLSGVTPGEDLRIKGIWETHPRYGQQFRIDSFDIALPASAEGIERYLASGIIKGIGEKTAARLVNHFQKNTLDILEKHPKRLSEVEGVGAATAERIARAWMDHRAIRELMRFLQAHGIHVSHGPRIFQEYGNEAIGRIESDPYGLARDIAGISFVEADTVARSLGLSSDHPERAAACIRHLIDKAISEGHVCVPENRILRQSAELFQISDQLTRSALVDLADAEEMILEPVDDSPGERVVYPKALHRAETGVAGKLAAMRCLPAEPVDITPDRITEEILQRLAIRLSDEQFEVLRQMLSHRVAVITGGPGTGKTTLIRSITIIFESLGRQVLLAAPTGRAARRLSAVTRRQAATIHKLLGYNPIEGGFEKDRDDPLEADVVIVDEASMVDTLLMYHLLQAVPLTATLILVGDMFQLPSVGPGNVLTDIIGSERIRTFELTTVFRQAAESPIIRNAHRVRRGEPLVIEPPDYPDERSEFYFFEQPDPARAAAMIVDLCQHRIPGEFHLDPRQDIQVLTPMHRGEVGTVNLNHRLQQALNPAAAAIDTPGCAFKSGDKVMHLRNNYQKEVFNGDIGIIRSIDNVRRRLTVDFDGRAVDYTYDELAELSLAYAISVHKAQGSEYPAVVVPIMTQHYILLQRNLLYTAITRGKQLVILVGTRRALTIALKNDKPRQRMTGLARRLMTQ